MADGGSPGGLWEDSPPVTFGEPSSFAVAAAVGDNVYGLGGSQNGEATNAVSVYNTSTQVWTDVRPMLSPRDGCAAAVLGSKIYVVGGRCDEPKGFLESMKTAEVYDTAIGTWVAIAPMSIARSDCAAVAVESKVYVFGGFGGGFGGREWHCTCEVYDPSTNEWELLPPMENGRDQLAAVAIHDKIYVVGGECGEEETVNTTEVYNTKTRKWQDVPDMSVTRKVCALAVVNGLLCVLWGTDEDGDVIDAVEAFDPHANVWNVLPPIKDTQYDYEGAYAIVGGRIFNLLRSGDRNLVESFDFSQHLSRSDEKRKRSPGDCNDGDAKRVKETAMRTLNEFLCPITTDLPLDPVIAEDQRIYERSAIEQWIAQERKDKGRIRSPVTNELMGPRLLSTMQVRNVIKDLVNEDAMMNDEQAERWKQRFSDFTQVKELERKASKGEADAMYQLGLLYKCGEKGLSQDFGEAYQWLKKASDLDHVAAMAQVGFLCLKGNGIKQNVLYGMLLLGRAEALGSDYAAFHIGETFETGEHGTTKDIEMTKKLYRRIGNNEYTVNHLSSGLRHIAVDRLKHLEG